MTKTDPVVLLVLACAATHLLHQFDHDPIRSTDKREARAGIARQRSDGDIRALRAQFIAGGIHIIDRQADVLQAI